MLRRVNGLKVDSHSGSRLWLKLVAVALGLTSTHVLEAAVPAAERASPVDRAAAQVQFDQGRELMDRGRARDACPRFEESQRLDSGLGTQYNLAECYEAIGRVASAHTLFLEVAAQAKASGQGTRERVARQRAEALEGRLPKLIIEVSPDQVVPLLVERDGSAVGNAQWGLAVPIDPGAHRVRATGPALVPWTTEVDVPETPGTLTVHVPVLVAEARRESFFAPTSHKIGLAALGLGVVSLGASGIFGLQAYSRNKDSNRAGCAADGCPDADSLGLRSDARAAGNRATWSLALGGAGLATAAVLFWALPAPSEQTELALRVVVPSAGPGGGLLGVAGRF